MMQIMEIIDAHVHFIDLSRPEGVAWPPPDHPAHQDFLPAGLLDEAEDCSLAGCVLIETSARPSDNEWMLQLAEREPLVLGVVTNLDPESEHFQDRLQRMVTRQGFKGLRLRPIENYDLRSEYLVDALAQLGSYNKTIELGATTTERLWQYARLAQTAPATTCILDHLGHPCIDGSEPDPEWLEAMEAFAGNENACCKFSGLLSRATVEPAPGILDFYRPTLAALFDLFGEDRLMFGSNWPVSRPAGRYGQAVVILEEFFSAHGTSVRNQFFCENARRVYRL